MKVGILSDTHGLIRNEVMEVMTGVDHIIHAGDIDCQEVIDSLESIAPVTVVRGNADKDWALHLPVTASIILSGKRFFIIHNKGKIDCDISGYDVIVYGHSHKYSCVEKDGQIWFNPGCCGKRKPEQEISFAIAEITGEAIRFDKIVIDGSASETSSLPKNIDSIIRKVMKLADKGKGTEDIARSCNISLLLADDICRMYLTHPGIEQQAFFRGYEGEIVYCRFGIIYILGGAISSATAGVLTTALGETYILIMSAMFEGTISEKELESEEGKKKIRELFKKQISVLGKKG